MRWMGCFAKVAAKLRVPLKLSRFRLVSEGCVRVYGGCVCTRL